jgi:hypothetical protein
MSYQHRSRDRILAILKANGTPMSPKQVFDEQPDPTNPAERKMEHTAIRKLLRDMQRGYVVCDKDVTFCSKV